MATSRLKAGTAKIKSEDTVAINPKGIEVGGRAPRLPEGNYLAEVKSAKAAEAKSSGNPMVVWEFKIVDGKYEGTVLRHRTVLIPQSLWSFRQVLEALKVKLKDSTMEIPLPRLVGRTCGIEVVDGDEYEGRIRSEINDFFRQELLEAEREADEDEEDFCTALALEPSRMCGLEIPPLTSIVDSLFYRSIYRYTEQLERYYDNFGEDHVHVVLFDDFSDDTAGVYRRVLNFLGVDTAFQPAFRHFNAGRAPRTRVLDRLIKNPPDWFVRGLRKVMPFETRMKVLNLFYRLNAKQKSNHLPEPLRTRLIREFRPEVEALGELIGRDLSHWSNIP